MAQLEDLMELKSELIRKPTTGAVFIADIDADLIETLTSATGTAPNQIITLATLPLAYQSLGYTTDDGVGFATETTTSDVTSWQSVTPTRSDITSETSTMTVTAQETKLLTIGLYSGVLTSGVRATATTGEVKILKPQRPSSRSYRVLSIMQDGEGDDAIWMARFLPRAKVTGKGEQSWGKGDAPVTYPITFTGERDSELGTAEMLLFGGPGWNKRLALMGIETA